ncbi:alpha/beta fold hydrolase [Candidatus Nanosalina sp. VS9-1]|uniref:alpha/beta fold hydrolase n=1 Tax=Candidatus Nanosalina sp. VS9-1 TaxID=3388566 RepID=UPI0039E10E57
MNTVKFSLSRVGSENMHYFESDTDSRIQLVFVPGGLNPDIWRQQLRYFSKSFRTASFRPTVSFRDYEGEKEALESILEQEEFENVVLVSHVFGNSLMQEFEDHENVVSTVLTGPRRRFTKIPQKKLINMLFRIGSIPKIAKKMFFSDRTEYGVVREFIDTFEKPDLDDFRTFLDNYRVSRPEKTSLAIHAEQDRFSSRSFAEELRPNISISVLENAGTFCFFEKPQEYNKALLDFLQVLEDHLEEEEIIELKEKNRSLMEFATGENRKGSIEKSHESALKKKVKV